MTKQATILALKDKLYCFLCVYCKDASTIGTIGHKCELTQKMTNILLLTICKDIKLYSAIENGVAVGRDN